MTARDEILSRLRRRAPDAPPPPPLPPVRSTALLEQPPFASRLAAFTAMLAKLGTTVEHVPDLATATRRTTELLAEHGARSLACSDHPLVADLAAALPADIERLAHDAPRDDLLRAEAGLSSAQWAVAETGTLVLVSADERHRLCTLLPDLHIALVPASRLVATLGCAFARLQPDAAPAGQTITFVTGPSRTADIELTLVVGVHGPKALRVLVVDDQD